MVLGQAYAQLRYENYALLTGYRQLVNQGFVNPQDNRMIPNTFEGATLTGTVGPVEYYLGYLTAMKRRNLDTFDNMATVAGVTTGETADGSDDPELRSGAGPAPWRRSTACKSTSGTYTCPTLNTFI